DPSAVIAKEYQASIVITTSGRVITGIVRDSDANAVTLQTANETVVLPRGEIESLKLSPLSMMPDDLLQPLGEHEVRSLAAYLTGRGQVPLRATAENVAGFFNGRDLTGWVGNPKSWTVERGDIVGRGAGVLTSELLLDDFHLALEVKVSGKDTRGGIRFRGRQ